MDLTIKELAARERVDERTVRRWIVKGAVETRRTPGGSVRIVERRDSSVPNRVTSSDISGHPST